MDNEGCSFEFVDDSVFGRRGRSLNRFLFGVWVDPGVRSSWELLVGGMSGSSEGSTLIVFETTNLLS